MNLSEAYRKYLTERNERARAINPTPELRTKYNIPEPNTSNWEKLYNELSKIPNQYDQDFDILKLELKYLTNSDFSYVYRKAGSLDRDAIIKFISRYVLPSEFLLNLEKRLSSFKPTIDPSEEQLTIYVDDKKVVITDSSTENNYNNSCMVTIFIPDVFWSIDSSFVNQGDVNKHLNDIISFVQSLKAEDINSGEAALNTEAKLKNIIKK